MIFDLDDTLYPERAFVRSGLKAAADYCAQKFSLPAPVLFRQFLKVSRQEGRGHIFDRVLAKYDLVSPVLISRLVKIYRTHRPQVVLPFSVQRALTRWKNYCHLALVTDGAREAQRNKITALGLGAIFETIICTDELESGKSKPHPAAFKKILDQFRVRPREAVYIGDDPNKDFLGPKSLKINTIRLLQGRLKDVRVSPALDAEKTFKNFGKMAGFIDQKLKKRSSQ